MNSSSAPSKSNEHKQIFFTAFLHMTANKTGMKNSLPLSLMTRGRGLRKEIYSNDLPTTFIHLWLRSSSFSQILVSRPPERVPKETQRLQRYSSRASRSAFVLLHARRHTTHMQKIFTLDVFDKSELSII